MISACQLVIIIVLLFNLLLTVSCLALLKKSHVDRFDGMCRGRKVPIRVGFRIVRKEGTVLFLNATVNVTEDIDDDPLAVTKLSRCRSKESLDTCEHVSTSSPVKFCSIISPKLITISPFYINYTPPFDCPMMRKNLYHAYNAKLDMLPFVVFPLGDWFWKSFTEVRHSKTNRLILCLVIDGYQSY